MKLVIDDREHGLRTLLREQSIEHDVEMLDLGDIVFRDDDGTIIFIIERKTVNDLKASICDGRHREQKARLMNCGIDKARIMYLIEGDISKGLNESISGVSVSILLGSIINTQLRDGIKVYRTSSMSETATFIHRMSQKMSNDLFEKSCDTGTDVGYAAALKVKKRDNITPNVWFIKQLSLVPGITEKIASVVVADYPCVKDLILAYENTEEEKRSLLLSDLKYPIAGGKTRRIGNKVSERIFKLFYGIC